MTLQSSLLNSGLCIPGWSEYGIEISGHRMLASCNIAATEVYFIPQKDRDSLHLQCRGKVSEHQDAAESYKAQVACSPLQ